jgi:hypothetical protein
MTNEPAQGCTMPAEARTGPGQHRVPIGTRKVRESDGHTVIKTDEGWRYLSHLIAEEKLRRPLRPGERVTYLDGDHTNLSPDNIGTPVAITDPAVRGAPRRTRRAPRVEVPLGDYTDQVRAAADAAGVSVSAWIAQLIAERFD